MLVNNTAGSGTGNGVVQVNSGATLGGGGTLSGVVTINSGGTISPTTGATLTLQSAPNQNGNAVINNNATLNVLAAWSNSSTVSMLGGSIIGGNLTNLSIATIKGFGAIVSNLINQGIVTATNGELRLLSSFSGAGTYRAVAGSAASTLTFAGTGSVSSLYNTGATIRVEGVLTNAPLFVNSGSLAMAGGRYQSGARLTNSSTAWITGYGTIDTAGVINQGTLLANNTSTLLVVGAGLANSGFVRASNGRLVINGAFTNTGTVNLLTSVGTFNGGVVNSGAWITDPTTNVFNDTFTVTSSGSISASAGDVYRFRSNFVNLSSQSNTWNTFNTTAGDSGASGTKFIFDNYSGTSPTLTQQFFTAGLALTNGFDGSPVPTASGVQSVTTFSAVSGFFDNFALDRLEIGNAGTNSMLELTDSFPSDGNNAALFVNDLWLFASSRLIISNDVRLYFVNSNNWSLANISLLGNAEIHQLLSPMVVIPEPGVLFLWIAGVATLYVSRCRKR